MPLYMRKIESVVSMAQLLEDSEMPQIEIKDLERLTPDRKINDVIGGYLPFVGYASTPQVETKTVKMMKRVNTLGTLHNPSAREGSVPDVGDANDSNSASEENDDAASTESSTESDGDITNAPVSNNPLAKSYLDAIVMSGWEERKDLFRYDLSDTETKIVPGRFAFVAQLNEGRATKKRATEFRIDLVRQDFDDSRFHFGKALQHEALFQLGASRTRTSQYHLSARVRRSPSLVLINVSPIEYGHVLLVPSVLDRIPQLVDASNLLLALHFADESANPQLRVGYNSLGAYGTINHMHYQAYYMSHAFPVELCETRDVVAPKPGCPDSAFVSVQEVLDYPARCLVFEVHDCLEALADVVGKVCEELAERNIPHNLLVCDRGHRVFLFPNHFSHMQAKGLVPEDVTETGVNPACFEIAGHMVMKRQEDYEALDEDMCTRMLSYCSVPDDAFEGILKLACEAARALPHEDIDAAHLDVAIEELKIGKAAIAVEGSA